MRRQTGRLGCSPLVAHAYITGGGAIQGLLTHYAQTMRVLGPIQTETSDSFTDSLLAFSVSYRRAWYGLGNGFRLITQRSVVQIHPPQPNLPFGFNGLSQSHELAR